MTKNDIKQYLTKTFITEANEDSTPAIALNKKIRKQNKKENDDLERQLVRRLRKDLRHNRIGLGDRG